MIKGFMTTKITKEQVEKIAKMAHLNVEGIQEKLASMFSDTLEKIEILSELDTSRVTETFQVTGLTNVFQNENSSSETLSKEDALSNASETVNGLFSTKGVFERSQ